MVKFSAVDDCENIGFQRTLVKYGMDRSTLSLWKREKLDEEKGWASPPHGGGGGAGCATTRPMRIPRSTPSITSGRANTWKPKKKENRS